MSSKVGLDAIKACVVYNPKTGVFYRVGGVRPSFFGPISLTVKPNGYGYISVGGKDYLAHRVAWFLMTGLWAEHEIDHRDRVRLNNKWRNLRAAERSDQLANSRRPNASGLRGAYLRGSKFHSQITRHGKQVFLGSFDTAEEAHAAYVEAAKQVHGEFASNGLPPSV